MPIYEYQAKDPKKGCEHCSDCFEELRQIADHDLDKCPQCGAPVVKIISVPSVGGSKTGLDDKAKAAGFTKLKRLGKGEYEKELNKAPKTTRLLPISMGNHAPRSPSINCPKPMR